MRADRLLSLLMHLQKGGLYSAPELAAALEVSERTIYRDIDALSSAGVPVYAQSGRNGGFALLESYRTDLTGLSAEETQALYMALLAHNVPQPLADLGVGKNLEGALRKLSAALPDRFRKNETLIRQRFVLDPGSWDHGPQTPNLQSVQQAVWRDQRLLIRCRTVSGVMIEQVVEPYGLVAKAGVWYLVYARKGHFQVRGVADLVAAEVLDEPFNRAPGFDLPGFWQQWVMKQQEPALRFEVLARVPADIFPQLHFYLGKHVQGEVDQANLPDELGWRLIKLSFDHFEEARMRLLNLGSALEVLEPLELRVVLQDFAQQILSLYQVG